MCEIETDYYTNKMGIMVELLKIDAGYKVSEVSMTVKSFETRN